MHVVTGASGGSNKANDWVTLHLHGVLCTIVCKENSIYKENIQRGILVVASDVW